MDTCIGISDDCLVHVRGVAREIPRNVFDWDDASCRDMFTLGFVHDIGYEYGGD